jgi:hypothetical protein
MTSHRVAVYYAWSRPGERSAPLIVIEDRFPTLFESRRMLYPRFAELSDPSRFDQNVGGFLDHILKKNFAAFVQQASAQTGQQVLEVEPVEDDGRLVSLSDELVNAVDTLIVISFDSLRTGTGTTEAELRAVRNFLAKPGNLLVVSPHHDIGHAEERSTPDQQHQQEATPTGGGVLSPRRQDDSAAAGFWRLRTLAARRARCTGSQPIWTATCRRAGWFADADRGRTIG